MTALAAPARPASPFKGLNSYTEEDAAFFFGRDDEIEIVIANLQARRLTLLYGASGVGKSSLLGAGVLHWLRDRAHRNLEEIGTPEFVPVYFADWRDDPLAALQEAIRDSVSAVLGTPALDPHKKGRLDRALRRWSKQADADILIVLDQFEEYFSYHGAEQGKGTLAVELPRAINRPHLRARFLLAIREDALAKLDRFKRELPTLFGTYIRISHLDRDSAREAITQPIEEYNGLPDVGEPVEIEEALVEAVLDQVTAGQVVLEHAGHGIVDGADGARDARIESPYLQLVMTRLWDEERRRGSPVLRLATFTELGGAQAIVRTHLDEALDALPENQSDLMADLFNYLVTPSGTKIAQTPSDLAVWVGQSGEEIEPVLDRLSAGGTRILRPVSAGDGPARYEIFHDVLAAPVLDWRARRVQRRLEQEREAAEAQASHERRRARMFRALAVVAGVALVLVVVGGAIVARQWRQARSQDESRAIAATARDLLDQRLDLAIPLSLAAYDRSHTLEARSALLAAAQRAARLLQVTRADRSGRSIWSAAFDPTGTRLATAGSGGVAVWDRRGRRMEQLVAGRGSSVAFNPRGDLLATSTYSGLTLWDAKSWKPTWQTPAGGYSTRVAFSADGASLAAVFHDGFGLWRLDWGEPKPVGWTFAALASSRDFAFSPTDPDLLAIVSGEEGRLELWDVAAARRLATGPLDVGAIAFSPNGRVLALARRSAGLRFWSVRTRRWVGAPLGAPEGPVDRVAFNGDGTTLAGARGRTVTLWDVTTPQATVMGDPLRAPDGVTTLAFAGDRLAATSFDGAVTLWDAAPRLRLHGVTHFGTGSVLAPDGRSLARSGTRGTIVLNVADGRETIVYRRAFIPDSFAPGGAKLLIRDYLGPKPRFRIWDARTGRTLHVPAGVPLASTVALADNGTLATEVNSTITLWDRSGSKLDDTEARGLVTAFAMSADAKLLVWGHSDGRVVAWRPAEAVDPVEIAAADNHQVTGLALSRDGRRLASSSTDATVSLWELESGRSAGTLVGHSDSVDAIAFSPDGETLASASQDRTIRFWDVESRRSLGAPLLLPTPFVSKLAFSRQRLVALTVDGTAVVWDKSFWNVADRRDLEALRKRLCTLVRRTDPTEWQHLLPGQSRPQPCAD